MGFIIYFLWQVDFIIFSLEQVGFIFFFLRQVEFITFFSFSPEFCWSAFFVPGITRTFSTSLPFMEKLSQNWKRWFLSTWTLTFMVSQFLMNDLWWRSPVMSATLCVCLHVFKMWCIFHFLLFWKGIFSCCGTSSLSFTSHRFSKVY